MLKKRKFSKQSGKEWDRRIARDVAERSLNSDDPEMRQIARELLHYLDELEQEDQAKGPTKKKLAHAHEVKCSYCGKHLFWCQCNWPSEHPDSQCTLLRKLCSGEPWVEDWMPEWLFWDAVR
jgi:hypothetical protein